MGVFHPNHDELHGFTVVIRASDGVTYIGRWHHEENGQILVNDVAIHKDGDDGKTQDEFISHTAQWGVNASQAHTFVPRADVVDVKRLGDVAKTVRGW